MSSYERVPTIPGSGGHGRTGEPEEVQILQVLQQETTTVTDDTIFWKGEVQTPAYRDHYFAIAYVVQLSLVILTAVILAPSAFSSKDSSNRLMLESSSPESTTDQAFVAKFFAWLVGMCLSTVGIVAAALLLMVRFSHQMVHLSFFLVPALFFSTSVVSVLDSESRENGLPAVYAIISGVLACLSAVFYLCLRRFVPFAAANLKTALSALGAHGGLMLLSLANGVISFVWITTWVAAFLGIDAYTRRHYPQEPCPTDASGNPLYDKEKHPDGMCDATPNVIVTFLMILSFCWTLQVIRNVLHTTTAGTVGTWWVSGPNSARRTCCGWGEIINSYLRAMTYSFGSICFGSLLVAILQTLENMLRNQRNNRRGNALLLCILECIVYLLRRWMEYFNSWAFVYVAMYGYDYLTAGKNVVNLFKTRGWTSFVADRLVFRVLALCNIGIAVASGFASVLVDSLVGSVFNFELDEDGSLVSHFVVFFCGFFFGIFLSSTAMVVVESAVRTVIVCFAEQASELEGAHPDLSEEMTQGWAQAYPEAWASIVATPVVATMNSNAPIATAKIDNAVAEESVQLV